MNNPSATSAKIRFVSGASTVTGSHFLLEDKGCLIAVDCGLLQGEAFADSTNKTPFPYDVEKLDILIVTHAHIDHVGRIPKLVKEGFKGEIISTPATRDLARVMLEDAYRIMHEEARRENRESAWSAEDIEQAFTRWNILPYHTPRELLGGFSLLLKDSGHILGSAICQISRGGRTIVFTGDLGNTPTPLLKDTEGVAGATYIVMESVYGDRRHEGREERREKLKAVIERARKHHGTLLIPSFSLEKTQVLLHEINVLVEEQGMAPIPVYLDSPLAKKVTELYKVHLGEFNAEVSARIKAGDDIFSFPKLKIVENVDESKAAMHAQNPKIIIAGSGMSTGGRIIHHEKHFLPDPSTTILFIGYQVPGSLGRQIQDGAKRVMVDDTEITVKAHVETLIGYSSHKDSENLLSFVETAGESLEKVFVVLGELKSALFLVQRIREYLGVEAVHPRDGEEVVIDM